MALAALELNNIVKSFGREVVLSNMSLQVSRGEGYVIVGPSGTGKSTALKTMAGLIEPDSGEVKINGQSLKENSSLSSQLGMLFQKNALFDSMTALENICFAMRERGLGSESEITQKAEELLNQVGLDFAAKLHPDEMSGGMQKRLGIARALAVKPQIIFYDDPTAGLDPITSRKIIDLILHHQKTSDMTLVAVTNDMNRAYQLAGQIGFMFAKEFLHVGSVEAVMSHPDTRIQQFIHGRTQGPLAGDVS